MTTVSEQIQQIYIGLLGRAADQAGLDYWAAEINGGALTLEQLRANIVNEQPEYAAGQGSMTRAQAVADLYENLFNRQPEAAGLEYWVNGGGASVNIDQLVLALIAGASAADQLVLDNKTEVAEYYTAAAGADYTADAAKAAVDNVDATRGSVDAAKVAIDSGTVASGQTFTLTASVDNLKITTPNTVDTITGVVDGDPGVNGNDSTFSVGDNIEGNGKTILRLAVSEAGTAAFATVKNIDKVNFIAGDNGTLTVKAGDWSNIGSVNLAGGVDGLTLDIEKLKEGTTIGLASAIIGSVSATLDMGSSTLNGYAYLGTTKDSTTDSTLKVSRAGIDAVLGSDVTGYAGITQEKISTGLAVGDVNATLGKKAYLSVDLWNSATSIDLDGADLTIGNVTVGNVNVNMADTASFSFEADNYATITDASGSETVTGGNVTVGNVTVAAGKKADVGVYVYNEIYAYTDFEAIVGGDLTIGNVTVTVGDDSDVNVEAYNIIENSDTGDVTGGNLKVGNITVAGGNDTDIYVELLNKASQTSSDGDAVVGDLTVGDIKLSVGDYVANTNEIDLIIRNEAYAYYDGFSATAGNLTVGKLDISMGTGTTGNTVSITNFAYMDSDTDAAAEVGNLTIADVTLNLGNYSTLDVNINNYAYAYSNTGDGSKATVGDLEVGKITAALGIGAALDINIENYASYADEATVGSFKLGGLVLTGDDGAELDFYAANYLTDATGDVVGDTDFGGIKLTGGVSADYEVENYVWAYNGDIKGTVAFGNVDVSMGKNGQFTGSFSATAENIGNVTMGDVSLKHSGNNGAWAGLSISATNGDVGTTTVGNVTLSAGKDGNASYSIDISATGKAGLLTVGNVSTSVGEAGYALLDIDTAGAVKLGNATLTATAKDANTDLIVVAGGAVNAGDISLVVTSAVTKDMTFAGGFDVTIDTSSNNKDITIGNIKVTTAVGNDAVHGDVGTLTTWLDLDAGTGKINVGNIDYSEYMGNKAGSAGATIDASGFATVGTITGSALKDTITGSEKGRDKIFGGDGADKFVFVTGNTGKTVSTVDQIMDWSVSDTLAVGGWIGGASLTAGGGGNYFEQVFADFAAFSTFATTNLGANTYDVIVGRVGSSLFVAVDDGNVDAFSYAIELVGVSSLDAISVANFVAA